MEVLKNFHSALVKPMAKTFGLFPQAADLSWIYSSPIPPTTVDLSASIVGGAGQTFALGVTPGNATGSVVLFWNGVRLDIDVGFTLNGGTVTMAASYEPAIGDTLIAVVWGSAS